MPPVVGEYAYYVTPLNRRWGISNKVSISKMFLGLLL